LVQKVTDDDGNVIERERRTTVNHAMKSCRRAWNVVARRHPGKLPLINPFAQMGLRSSDRETPTATFAELQTFREKAAELGPQSLGTAALLGWEWLQRGEDIFATFKAEHYRPKERPNMVRVIDEKTRTESWIPLFDEAGVALYPELIAELDAIKRERIGGLMLCRDWGDRGPWPTWPKPDMPEFHPHGPQGEGDHPRRRSARRAVVHIVQAWRLHRDWRRRTDGPRDHGARSQGDGQDAAEVRQAHHKADRHWHQKAARGANKN
jgi:hypothetical protein